MGEDKMSNDLFDKTGANEDEFFYNAIMNKAFNVFSPFEIDRNVDFPKKDTLGGVVLKYVGGGAAYFKIQREMPSDEELKEIFEIGKFLKESFGEYVTISILCTPDIEIRDIDLSVFEDMAVDFLSIRKNDGDGMLDFLMEKLKSDEEFTVEDHVNMIIVPFMGRNDEEEFQLKYTEFIDLFNEKGIEQPSVSDLNKSRIFYNRWFSQDSSFIF